jgi:hypothetical protein
VRRRRDTLWISTAVDIPAVQKGPSLSLHSGRRSLKQGTTDIDYGEQVEKKYPSLLLPSSRSELSAHSIISPGKKPE